MGNKVNKETPVTTPVIVVNDQLEFHGKAGYVVEPPKTDEDEVGVKMDEDGQVYQFKQADVEALV